MFTSNYQQKSKQITDWIRETMESTPMKNIVLGLSGGIDSALSATLSTHALGKDHVYIALLPYGELNKEGFNDAKLVIESLEIQQDHVFEIDIQKAVDIVVNEMKQSQNNGIATDSASLRNDNIRKGNIMARVRMIYLYDLAKKLNALVCGTENKTENLLGYFTRFGDEASDMEPIINLYKTEVWEMAKHLGIPEKIITKAPTAGLWESQTDEGELGFTYKEADQILYYYIDEKLSTEEIVAKGIKKEVIEKVLARVAENDFKHHLPYWQVINK